MRASSKGKERTAKVLQTGERGSLLDKCGMPIILDGILDLGFELSLGWRRDQYQHWVRKGILSCSQAETGKPGIGKRMVEHVHSMLVEGAARPEQSHHVHQCELVLVEYSSSW